MHTGIIYFTPFTCMALVARHRRGPGHGLVRKWCRKDIKVYDIIVCVLVCSMDWMIVAN